MKNTILRVTEKQKTVQRIAEDNWPVIVAELVDTASGRVLAAGRGVNPSSAVKACGTAAYSLGYVQTFDSTIGAMGS